MPFKTKASNQNRPKGGFHKYSLAEEMDTPLRYCLVRITVHTSQRDKHAPLVGEDSYN